MTTQNFDLVIMDLQMPVMDGLREQGNPANGFITVSVTHHWLKRIGYGLRKK